MTTGSSTMTVAAAAAALGVGKMAIYKAIARGTLRATLVRAGPRGGYVLDAAEVERYRASHSRPGHRRIR